jgi:hypothetical protein
MTRPKLSSRFPATPSMPITDLKRGDIIEVAWDDAPITTAIVISVDQDFGSIEVLLQDNPSPRTATWSICPTQVVGHFGYNVFTADFF